MHRPGAPFLRDTAARLFAMALVCLAPLAILTPCAGWAARYASIVIDANTGKTLYSRNADNRRYPASLTKMMTLYMVFEALENGRATPRTPIRISRRAASQPPTKMGLPAGSSLPLGIAIKILVTKSANDVAAAVAEHFAANEARFARMMTRKARSLGMSRTTFRNASGLPDRKQTTTARDITKLALALRRDFPQYYHYFKVTSVRYRGKTYRTHNHVLKTYTGADGLKTGYIRASGFNLATSAIRNGKSLIGVVFGGRSSRSRDTHMVKLLNASFPKAKRTLAHSGAIPLPAPPPPRRASRAQANAPAWADGLVRPARKPVANPTSEDSSVAMSDNWGVQVGVFTTLSTAQSLARRAAALVTAHLRETRPLVMPVKSGDGLLYRARVTGLPSYNAARSACALLRGENMACVVAAPLLADARAMARR